MISTSKQHAEHPFTSPNTQHTSPGTTSAPPNKIIYQHLMVIVGQWSKILRTFIGASQILKRKNLSSYLTHALNHSAIMTDQKTKL